VKRFASSAPQLALALFESSPRRGEDAAKRQVRVSLQRGAKRRAIHVIARKRSALHDDPHPRQQMPRPLPDRARFCKIGNTSLRLPRYFNFFTNYARSEILSERSPLDLRSGQAPDKREAMISPS